MHTVWYWIVVAMLTIYVVLDGFDIGAGIIHLMVARADEERRLVFAAIGPYWSGNEVFLVATGGLLLFAFPRLYAVGLSGFYLPLMMVLWLLIFRGISIEFRNKESNELWRTFWDTVFSLASLLLSMILGAALGNVLRGVPIGTDGFFAGALWTNFSPFGQPGLLDWYSMSVGIFAALALAGHGALWVWWKTEGALSSRCYFAARLIWRVTALFGIMVTAMTIAVREGLYENLMSRPWSWPLAALVPLSFIALFFGLSRRLERFSFLASSLLLACLLLATAALMFPNMLISTVAANYTITADNAAVPESSLKAGLVWWIATMVLTALYFINLFRVFRGKAKHDAYLH
jgi:cytochrome d ubiquinol oxidase subunit II